MNPDDVRDFSVVQEPSAQQKADATRVVLKYIGEDAPDKDDILMALGLKPPDFQWFTHISQSGKTHSRKLTLDGTPYPDEEDKDACEVRKAG